MKYDKLVRDKVPEIIEENGQKPSTHIANNEEYLKKLNEKLVEESHEFMENPSEGELIDVLEVIDCIKKVKNYDEEKIDKLRKKKFEEKGGFEGKVILDEVND